MKVKGTLTIDVWYDKTDLDEVEDDLHDLMSNILKKDLLGSRCTNPGPYVEYYAYEVATEIVNK